MCSANQIRPLCFSYKLQYSLWSLQPLLLLFQVFITSRLDYPTKSLDNFSAYSSLVDSTRSQRKPLCPSESHGELPDLCAQAHLPSSPAMAHSCSPTMHTAQLSSSACPAGTSLVCSPSAHSPPSSLVPAPLFQQPLGTAIINHVGHNYLIYIISRAKLCFWKGQN